MISNASHAFFLPALYLIIKSVHEKSPTYSDVKIKPYLKKKIGFKIFEAVFLFNQLLRKGFALGRDMQ